MTTSGRGSRAIVPSSGIDIWKSDRSSSRYASKASSARSTSSISSTGGLVAGDRLEQRPLEQIALREDVLLLRRPPVALVVLEQLDREQLALVVPFVHRRVRVESFVALQADQPRARAPRASALATSVLPTPASPSRSSGRPRSSISSSAAASAALGDVAGRVQLLLQASDLGSCVAPAELHAVFLPKSPRSQSLITAHSERETVQLGRDRRRCRRRDRCRRDSGGSSRGRALCRLALRPRAAPAMRADLRGEVVGELLQDLIGDRRPSSVRRTPPPCRSSTRRSCRRASTAPSVAPRSTRAVEVHRCADEPPVLSVPLPTSRSVRAAASTSFTSMSPRNDIVAGPTLTVTVPL